MSDTISRIAVLGLGAMGSRVAARLLDAGRPVAVWNRSPAAAQELEARGATLADDPAAAAAGAAAVLVCVRDDEASTAVWAALRSGLGDGALAIELSTISPAQARRLAAELGDRFVESPMVGSRPQIEAGQLQLLIGAEPATLERARELLEQVAGGVHHIGRPGDAAVMKLVVNGLLAVQMAALGELLDVVRGAGLEERAAAELLAALPVSSPAVARSVDRIVGRQTAPAFPLELVAKDVGYLLGEAGDPARAPVFTAVQEALAGRLADGQGELDLVTLAMPRP